MANNDHGRDETERLHGKLDDVRQAMSRVEIWAGALAGFAQPIPPEPHRLAPRRPQAA